jgi:hypothetical protein
MSKPERMMPYECDCGDGPHNPGCEFSVRHSEAQQVDSSLPSGPLVPYAESQPDARMALCDMMERLGFESASTFHDPTITVGVVADMLFSFIREEEARCVRGAEERVRAESLPRLAEKDAEIQRLREELEAEKSLHGATHDELHRVEAEAERLRADLATAEKQMLEEGGKFLAEVERADRLQAQIARLQPSGQVAEDVEHLSRVLADKLFQRQTGSEFRAALSRLATWAQAAQALADALERTAAVHLNSGPCWCATHVLSDAAGHDQPCESRRAAIRLMGRRK